MKNKRIYLTKEQLKKINEDNSSLDINVDIEKGQTPLDALSKAKKNTTDAAGSQIANDATYSFSGKDLNCSKKINKKTIEEERVKNLISKGKTFSKKELSKKILG